MTANFSSATALFISNCASVFGATAHRYQDEELLLDLQVPLVDGRSIPYQILAKISGSEVTARELEPLRLPAFCPERHVNNNGTFCMYWEGDQAINVIDEHSAMEWWETLLKYLMLQERATKIRKWPNNHTWAHGDAAGYQKKTYLAATNLGDHFSEGINSQLFRVEYCKRNSGNGSFLRVYKEKKHFYTVWVNHKRVACLRQNCLCGKNVHNKIKSLRRCTNHANAAVDFAIGLWEWRRAEAEFWDDYKDRSCCGTMKDCPLRK